MFCTVFLSLHSADVFLMVRLQLWVSGRKTTGEVPSSTQHINGTCYQLDGSLGMLTWITWLGFCQISPL